MGDNVVSGDKGSRWNTGSKFTDESGDISTSHGFSSEISTLRGTQSENITTRYGFDVYKKAHLSRNV